MLNLTTSFISTFISLIFAALNFIKGPVALVVGVCLVVFLLASPAEAATIKCAMDDCPPVETLWSLLEVHEKAGIFIFFGGLINGIIIMWHDRKIVAARLKEEEQEWIKKYYS